MLTLNNILEIEGIDPEGVRLVRHHQPGSPGVSQYMAWRANNGSFEEYQRIQTKQKFKVGDLLASFVVTPAPRKATLFVGLYAVQGVGRAPNGTRDPLNDSDVSGKYLYVIDRDPRLQDYVGRLVISWGAGAKAWFQNARNHSKPVVAIGDEPDPPFPGFTRFRLDIDELLGLYPGWIEVLRNVKGVYLLVDKVSGKQYVGSAKGGESLYGRLKDYAGGHYGGNIELKVLADPKFQVSILEVVGSQTADERIEEIESAWKQKLLSRQFGLNGN